MVNTQDRWSELCLQASLYQFPMDPLTRLQRVAIAGIVVSLYALYVEWSYEFGSKALCDLSETWSCTKVCSTNNIRYTQ